MPYSWPNNIPDYIKSLPAGAQKLFVRVFNDVIGSRGTEDEARIAAWAAVKRRYKKVGDRWVLREMSFEDISPISLRKVSDQEILSLHRRAHQLWGRFFGNGDKQGKPSGFSREDLINAHVFLVKELRRREMSHNETDKLDRLSKPLLKEDLAQGDYVLVPAYVSIVGSSVKDPEGAKDLDILVRQQYRDSSLEIRVMRALGKDKDYHFIYDPKGPHDDYIPIFDLVLRAKGKPEVQRVEAQEIRIDLGCNGRKPEGYIGVDIEYYDDVDVLWDCEKGLPFPDNYADEVRAWHFLEHMEDQDAIMTEIHRVLKPGGVLVFEVPSTKGEGAFVPGHKSYWNKTTFLFYTDPTLTNGNPLFEVEELEERQEGDYVYVKGKLRALKGVLQETLTPFGKFIPPKPAMAGFTEFFSTEELWENWASKRLNRGLHIEIEEKLNGFRSIIRKQGDRVRIEFEDSQQDRSDTLPDLTDPLKKIPDDFVLDANIGIDKDGHPLPRIRLMKLTAKQPDLEPDERVKATLFDIPYWKEDLTKLPLGERRERLEAFYNKCLKGNKGFALTHWTPIYSKEDLERKAKRLASLPQSEGIVAKVVESPYSLTGATSDWAKIKHVAELKVRVLRVFRNANGTWGFRCGLLKGVSDFVNLTDDGKYVDMGKTFNASFGANPGDIITVQVQELFIKETPKGRELDWLGATPIDIDRARKEPYFANQAIDIAKRAHIFQEAEARKGRPEEGGLAIIEPGMSGEAVLQKHQIGKKDHRDLRLRITKPKKWPYLVGITLATGDTYDRGDLIKHPDPKKKILVPEIKPPQPLAWLNFEGTTKPGEAGSTSNLPGHFWILDRPKWWAGVQEPHYKEFKFKGKILNGRWILQYVPVPGDEGRREWMFSKPEKQEFDYEPLNED